MTVIELPGERWLPVAGYEGIYEVSDLGRVRSLDRYVVNNLGRRYRVGGRLMKPNVSNQYSYLSIGLNRDGREVRKNIHRLVMEAFAPRDLPVVRHLNGDKNDNRLINLAWGTQSDNIIDSVRHGTHHNGCKSHCKNGHKFTPENTRATKDGRACKLCELEKNRRAARRRAERKVAIPA